jgi:hypothetical protein
LLLGVSEFDVYLAREKIAEKKLNLSEVQKKTAEYLLTLNGIADVLTAEMLLKENFTDSVRAKLKAGFYPERSGDIIFVLKPGWLENFHKGTSHGSPYSYDTHVPLLFFGWKIKNESSTAQISITQIAPTISEFLRIPKPNGSTAQPIKIPVK